MTAVALPPVVGAATDPATAVVVVRLAAAEAAARRRPMLLLSTTHDLEDHVRRLATSGTHASPVGYERTDDLYGALVDHSKSAELVVLAREVDGHVRLTEQVAAHASCPVVVTGRSEVGTGPVVLALDPRAGAAAAGFAFAEAGLRGVDLSVLYVTPEQPDGALTTVDPFAYDPAAAAAEGDRMLAEALAGSSDRYPDVVVHRRAWHEPNVVEAVVREAAGAGLLVVGARDHPRLSDRLLGSVTTGIIRSAAGPVVVVPVAGGNGPVQKGET